MSQEKDEKRPFELTSLVEIDKICSLADRVLKKRLWLQKYCAEASERRLSYDQEEKVRQTVEASLDDIQRAVDKLDRAIEDHDFGAMGLPEEYSDEKGENWCLGKETIRGALIRFLRGKLEPIDQVIVAPALPENVVIALFRLGIPGISDYLKRETHGASWGYHYHYLDAKGRRSDTLLSFEPKKKQMADGAQAEVLKWEHHSEGNHFKARAGSWGTKKRKSVYRACVDDIGKRSLKSYKTPKKTAELVWPTSI